MRYYSIIPHGGLGDMKYVYNDALESCNDPEELDALLVSMGYKCPLEKCKYLAYFMKAAVHRMGKIDPVVQYNIAQREFFKGYWKDWKCLEDLHQGGVGK